jgi:Fe-S cluster assembly ATP-binding protein
LKQVANFLTKDENNIMALADKLSLTEHLNRDINLGFSGGERKRSELFQILLQQPELLLLDEPESGVDLENISLMGKVVDQYLSQENKSALIITHSGYILDYVKAQRGCMIMDGSLWCRGDPKNIFSRIKEGGYRYCKECHE